MNVQFKKGALELCVLVLISQKDYYGYELAQKISEKIELAEGTLYPILRRLTKDNYLTCYLSDSSEGPPRKYYSITVPGREQLAELIAQWMPFAKAVDDFIAEGTSSHGEN
ncbi:PadR family transcriptional regulator [Paenibacillus macerans]|uniref:PadR family transcriptional regulator n=1 Tax=Paenibacillus macerans TaxID=44252 RepID=UPI00203C1C49|nr:PadR family transcriptional regulator [Paenibacillus macerans]MCM3702876.1 PadR family transcriptional regulator [Paenibacillus macerans]